MSIVERLKQSMEDIKSSVKMDEFDSNTYSFISLNNGAGARTVAASVAMTLSERYKVCVLDCNFPQPGMGITLNTPITPDMSILKFTNSSKEIKDCIHQVKGQKNIWIVSTSPIDQPVEMGSMNGELVEELVKYLKNTFDYLIISMAYNPFAEWFVNTLKYVDRGYFVWDEQIDNVIKTKAAIDYIHAISHKAHTVNNVIINKRTKFTFPYAKVDEIECKLIAELPYSHNITVSKNEGKTYSGYIDRGYHKALGVILDDIVLGQSMVEPIK